MGKGKVMKRPLRRALKKQTTNNKVATNVVIDFEFNGLPKVTYQSEICQVKIAYKADEQWVKKSYNFKTRKKPQISAFLKTGTIEGEKLFTKKRFLHLLKENGIEENDNFIGFSIGTDKEILKSYNIHLHYTKDLQEEVSRTRYEKKLAINGRGLEACYQLITGKQWSSLHNDTGELDPLIEILELIEPLRKKGKLTVFPYGELAGMPLRLYCEDYRRRADGYRYNNSDLLAKSLDYYCDLIDCEW